MGQTGHVPDVLPLGSRCGAILVNEGQGKDSGEL